MLSKDEILNLFRIALIDFNNEILDNLYSKKKNSLEKDNIEYYVPISKYNPSTKKYVDDLIMKINESKVDKVENKVLSSNDYSDEERNKLINFSQNFDNLQPKIDDNLQTNSKETTSAINEINLKIDEVINPFLIMFFSPDKNIIEKGSIAEITLNWDYSKQPDFQMIENNNIEKSIRSITYQDVQSDSIYNLKAIYNNSIFEKNTYVYFYNAIYYGVSNSLNYDSDLINSLTSKILSNSKNINFSVNAIGDQYIFYCIPSRFKDPRFIINGFEGGFDKVVTIDFTNNFNYTEKYDIYKSTNSNLGNTNINIL